MLPQHLPTLSAVFPKIIIPISHYYYYYGDNNNNINNYKNSNNKDKRTSLTVGLDIHRLKTITRYNGTPINTTQQPHNSGIQPKLEAEVSTASQHCFTGQTANPPLRL